MSKNCKRYENEKVQDSCCKENNLDSEMANEINETLKAEDSKNESDNNVNDEKCEGDTSEINLDKEDEETVVIDETVLLKKQLQALKDENSNLKEENKLRSNKLKAVEEKYSNLFSEYDNFRKRTIKEKEGIFNDSCETILKEFLPVLDNLERAVVADGNIEDLKNGVEIIIKSFKSALGKLEVEEISTEGEFDPNVHDAVMHIEDKNLGKNEVTQVFQKGYKRGEKVLRHSMVQVAN